ncbi:hypothetical protein EJ419_02430 [Alloscardovia theropitheci]|uniref:Uncharacterized protein n=2 Tax=Alloscardovia theropitheci TaxID=2496842 RepID=A0A4R0QTK9_9BIFI|nr:hypothetical protein EJ419_02430 [Alloscardovia theropitheci]
MDINLIMVFGLCVMISICGAVLGYWENLQSHTNARVPIVLDRVVESGVLALPLYIIIFTLIMAICSAQGIVPRLSHTSIWLSGIVCACACTSIIVVSRKTGKSNAEEEQKI